MVGAGEAALAVGALERLDPRVLPEVSRQLVRTGELPRATLPHALVGLLACAWREREREREMSHGDMWKVERARKRVRAALTGVRPAVRLEVGALGVHFVAAVEVAAVDPSLLQRVRGLDGGRMLGARMDYDGRVVAPERTRREDSG